MEQHKERAEKPENKFVLGLYIFFWLIAIIMFSFHFIMENGKKNVLEEELAKVNASIAAAMAEQERLEFEFTFFDSDSYLEQLARERLGMARPNEIVFRNIAE